MGRKLQLPNEPLRIGARIQAERLRVGYTLDKLATVSGIDKGQISRFCAGEFKTWSKNLQKVCDELQIKDVLPCGEGSEALSEVLREVQIGWELAGARRKAYENAIVALAKLTRPNS